MGAFIGEDPNGTDAHRSDDLAEDTGSIDSRSLNLTTSPAPRPTCRSPDDGTTTATPGATTATRSWPRTPPDGGQPGDRDRHLPGRLYQCVS
jgi:hypothetical protein